MTIYTTFYALAEAFNEAYTADYTSAETGRLASLLNDYLTGITTAPVGLTSEQVTTFAENHIIAKQEQQA